MAACTRRLDKVMCSVRLLRNLQHQNERSLSTSLCRLALGSDKKQPPKFTPPPKPVIIDKTQTEASLRKFVSPEFVHKRQRINRLKYVMERKDMIQRRKVLNIPEFYVGSILAVTMMDPHAVGKTNHFVGICVQRGGNGLGGTFILRNVIDNQGVEICYEMYSPRLQKIEVLKLEKRLDENLMYLRDALPQFSTVDFNMKPVSSSVTGEVPVNKVQVKMKPRPWSKRWERPKFGIRGIRFEDYLSPEQLEHAQKWAQPWREHDMLHDYDTSQVEEDVLKDLQREFGK